MPKFDLIISNPPYKRGLHLKILDNIKDITSKIVFIHPIKWLYDKRTDAHLQSNKTKKLFENNLVNYEIIENGSYLFNILLFTDLVITYWEENPKHFINIWNIDIHGNSKEYQNLKYKIFKYAKNKNLKSLKNKNKNFKYSTGLAKVRGNYKNSENKFHPDFFTFIQNKNQDEHINSKKYNINFYFDTLNEAQFFRDYLKLKITRFALSLMKIGSNIDWCLEYIPLMPTYEKPWTEESVAQELGLTTEELKWATDWIPNYYPEDEMK